MSFRSVFVALVIATGLVVSAFLLHARRPKGTVDQPSAEFVRATGKCAECHAKNQHAIVHEYEKSAHAKAGVSCLDCHQVASGQTGHDHNGFAINAGVTPANCRSCHESVYQQFARSRHAAPSWAAVRGAQDVTPAQVEAAEQYQPGAVKREPNSLARLEGGPAETSGCLACHSIGRPNADDTIGNCTPCHTRHESSVAMAREPSTCGQCHLGPDHSQMEIYTESRHGVMFATHRNELDLKVSAQALTTQQMFVPTCATCHMSGLNGLGVTHDPSERLSYFLFAEVTKERPDAVRRRAAMEQVCLQCHTKPLVDRVYSSGAAVVAATNAKVEAAKAIVGGLREEGLLSGPAFQHPMEFDYFDLWHYYGRTAKHGAFMGGADFVQWHGNYPILKHTVALESEAAALRAAAGK